MLAGRDSAYPPSDAQLDAFYAQGVRVFGGYIKLGNDGIYNGWSKADFDRIKGHGMTPIAYMSGWDDPTQARAVADSWGVSIVILDIESGIRPDGSYVQGWLNTARAGEYGNLPVHHYTATIHEDAGYYGYDPRATWPTWIARPAGVCGWQWQGSHNENGLTVDSAWWDDGITSAYSSASGSLGGFLLSLTDQEQAQVRDQVAFLFNDLINGAQDNANGASARLAFLFNDMIAGTEDNPKGVAATVHRIEAAINEAKAAAQAAQAAAVAAQTAAQGAQAAAQAVAAEAADIKAIRAKTDKDLS